MLSLMVLNSFVPKPWHLIKAMSILDADLSRSVLKSKWIVLNFSRRFNQVIELAEILLGRV